MTDASVRPSSFFLRLKTPYTLAVNEHSSTSTPGEAPQRFRRRTITGTLMLSSILAACAQDKREASAPASTGSVATTAPPTGTPRPDPTAPPPTPTPIPISPLSGKQVADAGTIRRRIVAAKVDNAPLARPQFGLGAADVVYEQLAEGGLTRFLAFFLELAPDKVGPIRSARLTDIYLGQEWDFLLAYAGAGTTTSRLLAEALIPVFKAPELGFNLEGTPYFRDPNRPIPHNMFVRIEQVREAAAKEPGIAKEVEIRPFPFADPPAQPGPLRTVNMPYVPAAAVTWSYDPETSSWKRFMAGGPHMDANKNEQIRVENVVIQHAQIFTAQNVEPDSAGNPVLDTLLRGENRLRLFHSGQMFEGTWSKEHDRAKTQYRLADGSPMPFRPGRVWIHIVPTDFGANWA